jgi:hypothetical protein
MSILAAIWKYLPRLQVLNKLSVQAARKPELTLRMIGNLYAATGIRTVC